MGFILLTLYTKVLKFFFIKKQQQQTHGEEKEKATKKWRIYSKSSLNHHEIKAKTEIPRWWDLSTQNLVGYFIFTPISLTILGSLLREEKMRWRWERYLHMSTFLLLNFLICVIE